MDEPLRCGKFSLLIVSLFLLATFQPFFGATSSPSLADTGGHPSFSPENTTQLLTIASYPNGVSSSLKLEVPAGEALTGLDLRLEPEMLPRNEIYSWSNAQVWNHSDATAELVNYNSTGLTLSGTDVGWDLNNNGAVPTGWTRSSSSFAMVNSLSCGRNGSTGHSLNTRGGSSWWMSPTVDMSGLAQGQISYWVRQGYGGCGEEPDSGENFYFQYRTASNSWTTLRSFAGSTAGSSASGTSYTTILPSAAFHSNFALRFYQNTGSGTCCDYWFFDDVSLTQPGGQGNWTSPAFGWGNGATYSMMEGPYGLLSMEVEKPGASKFNWTVVDATTLAPIEGFEAREEIFADLGQIDWLRFPTLRLVIRMESGGGGMPILHTVNLNGRIVDSFHNDPSGNGWDVQGGTWNSAADSISGGSGAVITSPYYNSTRPIAKILTSFASSGLGHLNIELNGDILIPISSSSTQTLPEAGYSIRFIFNGTGTWTIQSIQADLLAGDYPQHPRLDIAQDGELEWAIDDSAIGPWGWQERLSNGNPSSDLAFSNGGSKSVMMWLPDVGVDNLLWSITHIGGGSANATWWRLKVGPTIIEEGGLGLFSGRATVSITPDSLTKLNDNLSTTSKIWSTAGVGFVAVEIEVGCETGILRVGGISAPYSPIANMSFDAWDSVVQAVNDEIPTASFVNGKRIVPLPFILDFPGAMSATITGVFSTSGLQTTSASLLNSSTTLTPSWQWFELNSLHQTSVGMPGGVQIDFIGLNNRSTFEFPVDGGAPASKGDSNLIRWHPDDPHSVTYDSESVNSTLRFQIEPMWDDEESFEIRVRLVLADGRRSVPEVASFGGGTSLGIENDVEIRQFKFINELGVVIPDSASYLRGARNVTVEAEIGFHNVPGNFAPRDGNLLVELFEDDVEIHNTTNLEFGLYTHTYLVPPGSNDITYRIDITPLRGGWDYTTIDRERTFQTDSLAPVLVSSNIEHYDHRAHSASQVLRFDIYDRPVLPHSLTLMLWREWLNDYDFDAWPDEDEFFALPLTAPGELSVAQGNYTYSLNDNGGEYGDKVAGYIIGADPAGNPLQDGGGPGPDDHLFMYELALPESPVIDGEAATMDGDRQMWLHPGNTYDLILPFDEPNGYSDVDEIILELATNAQSDTLPISWSSADNRCTTTSSRLTIVDCAIRARDGILGPYVDELQMEVSFTIDWSLLSEGELRREPTMEIFDRSRQSSYSAMPQLRWRWSSDLHVPFDMISLTVPFGVSTSEGAWLTPGSPIQIQGVTTFAESGQVPEFSVQVEFKLAGQELIAVSQNGSFYISIEGPWESGSHALSWGLTGLPPQGNDVTDGQTALFWIVVDGDGPRPVEVVTPRLDSTIPLADLGEVTIDLRIAETQEIDPDSLRLQWLVTEGEDPKGVMIAEGTSTLIIPSGTLASLQLSAITNLNLAEVLQSDSLESALTLHVWVTGQDAAGNLFDSNHSFNSYDSPFASWPLEQKIAKWSVEAGDIEYQRIFIEVGESIVVQIDINNIGTASGSANVVVETVNLAGQRLPLHIATAEAAPGQSETMTVSWQPEEMGIQWIEVSVNGGTSVKGEEIDVLQKSQDSLLSGSLGGVDTVILVAFLVLSCILGVVLLMFLRDINSRRDKGWENDYWDDLDDEESEKDEADGQALSIAAKAAEYDQIYSTESAPAILQPASSANTQSGESSGGPSLPTTSQPTADPYGQAEQQATSAPAATTSAGGTGGAGTGSAVGDGDVGEDWVQDGNGHWWKKNDEGYWWRLGEDGQWHSADDSGYA
ncbi:MAG TPA: hypothetical protein EYN46_02640 [Candidatus Poseidoniales archaeon]|nr:hypothetical protein [Candidatus Poseidoniales archaeon]